MSLLKQNKIDLNSRSQDNNKTIPEEKLQEVKPRSTTNEKNTENPNILQSFSLTKMFKRIIFMFLFQSVFFVSTVFLSTKVPFIGTILKHTLEGMGQINHYFELLELNNEVTSYQSKVKHLEGVNKQLKDVLTTVENEHPELFNENHSKKGAIGKISWKPIAITIGIAATAYAINSFFFGSSGTANAIAGTITGINRTNQLGHSRHQSLADTVGTFGETIVSNAKDIKENQDKIATLGIVTKHILETLTKHSIEVELPSESQGEEMPSDFLETPKNKKSLTFANSEKESAPKIPGLNYFTNAFKKKVVGKTDEKQNVDKADGVENEENATDDTQIEAC